ncbi:GNAT family N-acetyltransferase [Odoribacter lunatus]|uniref:GNAT family N-acetyltransferase n=1 Tax=Odoribacter lunatus TaxID=2941335 RepID=UPI00203F5E2A|nr:GNAT family N-acetyltransferase [Odoribacter lunatus]
MIKEEVIQLWRTCFSDTEEFIHFYFSKKYSDHNTLVHTERQHVVAALQMLPYPMTWCNTQVMTSYISGACTHPDYRSKGYMRQLLIKAFETMRNRKIAFSVLIPQDNSLYEYYSRLEYSPVFAYTPENYYLPVRHNNPAVSIISPETADIPRLYAYFKKQMEKRDNCIQHSPEDFQIILEDLHLARGHLFFIENQEKQITGLSLASLQPDKIMINELLYDGEEEKEALLQTAAYHWGKSEIECRVPVTPGKQQIQKGMARVINVFQTLSVYAATHPQKTRFLHVNDPFIPANTGYYRITNGKAFRTGKGINKTDYDLNIRELTQILFEKPGFISLMLE